MRACVMCGTSIEGKRPQAVYCGPTCSKRAQRAGVSRSKFDKQSYRLVEASPVTGRLRKPTIDDVSRLFVQSLGLAASFMFASKHADYRLRPTCARMSRAIIEAIEREDIEE